MKLAKRRPIEWTIGVATIVVVLWMMIVGAVAEAGVIEKTFTTSKGWLEKAWDEEAATLEHEKKAKKLYETCKCTPKQWKRVKADIKIINDEIDLTRDAWWEWKHEENTEANIELHLEKAKSMRKTVAEYLGGFIISESTAENCSQSEVKGAESK